MKNLKVDWEKIPSEYKWVAIDENGEVWAFENKPSYDFGLWWRKQIDPAVEYVGFYCVQDNLIITDPVLRGVGFNKVRDNEKFIFKRP